MSIQGCESTIAVTRKPLRLRWLEEHEGETSPTIDQDQDDPQNASHTQLKQWQQDDQTLEQCRKLAE